MTQLIIRKAENSDRAFIYDSWMHAYARGNAVNGMDPKIYRTMYHKVIDELLETSTTVVLTHPDPEDPTNKAKDQLVGWGCFQDARPAGVVHFIYVKRAFRNMGFAREMLKFVFGGEIPKLIFVTHFTGFTKFVMRHAAEAYPDVQVIYNPFIAFDRLPAGWTRT
jgi:hypothetical protein